MQYQQVFYLLDTHTGQRLRYYRTQTGARIAQRLRNRHLGFRTVIERQVLASGEEQELCRNSNDLAVIATYSIIEDHIEINLE